MTCGRGTRPNDLPDNILWQTTDVADGAAVQRLKENILAEFGQLSILVNNAGVQIEKTILDTTDEDWDWLMGANAKGVFLACRALAFELATDPDAAKADALARHPAGRFGRPEDVAKLAVWLGSDDAGFATGQCYTLDGGLTAASPLRPGLF